MSENELAAQLANEFEQLRANRLGKLSEVQVDSIDDILADISNLAMSYYISKKLGELPEGFVSNSKRE